MGLFRGSDPSVALGDTVTAIELLARGVDQAESMTGDDRLKAETFQVIGEVYEALGENERAEDLVSKAERLRRETGTAAELAESLRRLTSIRGRLRKIDSASVAAEEALQIARSLGPPPSEEIALGLRSVGQAMAAGGLSEEADSLFQLSYDMLVSLRGTDDEETIEILSMRVDALQFLGAHTAVVETTEKILAWRRESPSSATPRYSGRL